MGRSIWSALFYIEGPADMTSTSDPKLDSIKFGYMGMVRQKRSYSLILQYSSLTGQWFFDSRRSQRVHWRSAIFDFQHRCWSPKSYWVSGHSGIFPVLTERSISPQHRRALFLAMFLSMLSTRMALAQNDPFRRPRTLCVRCPRLLSRSFWFLTGPTRNDFITHYAALVNVFGERNAPLPPDVQHP